jgi:hypothetical protein
VMVWPKHPDSVQRLDVILNQAIMSYIYNQRNVHTCNVSLLLVYAHMVTLIKP